MLELMGLAHLQILKSQIESMNKMTSGGVVVLKFSIIPLVEEELDLFI